jgi:lipopolysaccharide biosynthesis regulator YciM
MDPFWLLALLPLAVASGWLAARRARSQPRHLSAPKGISETYFRSINFLANDQHDKALDVLAKALEDHDESLEIQLALGTLFRRRGEIEKATQIHQSLISRAGLRSEQKSQVLFELANDYFKAGLLDRSENLLLELGASEGLREPALRLLIQIYESEREWESAIAAASRLGSLTAEAWSPVVAQYHCELGERDLSGGNYSTAKGRADQALKLYTTCARAIILLGRLEALMGKHRQAITIWMRLCEEHPDMVHEVARLVQASAEILGKPVLYIDFLNRALATSADERLQLSLVDYLFSQGRAQEAETRLLSWVDENASLPGLHRLLEIRTSEDSTAVSTHDYQLVQRVTGKLLADRTGYECRFCGFQGRSLHWQCPGCKHWDSTMPRLATTKWS